MFTRFAKRRRASAAALSLALFASACGGTPPAEQAAAPAVTESAEVDNDAAAAPGLPQLIGDTVAGAQFDTNDLAGQDIAVWFWAPW